jgi:hypothetical protein
VRVTDEKTWAWSGACRTCQSGLEVEPGDVRCGEFGGDYGGGRGEDRFYVACPVCTTNVFIPNDTVWPSVADAAKRRSR